MANMYDERVVMCLALSHNTSQLVTKGFFVMVIVPVERLHSTQRHTKLSMHQIITIVEI